MCGRYRLSRRKQLIAEYFDTVDEIDWEPRYNIAPSQNVGIIRQDRTQPVRKFSLVRWGLIPYWAKDSSIGQKMINARSETVLDKPAFREAFQIRRCLVPADGFYEWKRNGRSKQPIHIGMKDDSLFAFAGIWDRWKDASGNAVETCSILTTTPNSLLAEVHDRMPVILEPEDYELWLDPGFKDLDSLTGMLKPFDPAQMKCYRVSTLVNSPANDNPKCAAEIDLTQPATGRLF
jgi:putative SOS response-associated peptidase YedK